MRFSVIVVHRNGAEMLLDTLRHVHAALGERDEVLLVDNGSNDDSLLRVRALLPRVRIIENGCNAGFAAACNQGMHAACGRYRLLLNNDARIPMELLDRLQADFEADLGAGLIGPALVGEDRAPQRTHGVLPRPWGEIVPRPLRPRPIRLSGRGLVEVPMLVGACVAVRSETLAQVGGLDEDFFFYYEDVEWCRRIGVAGWRLLLEQDIKVQHRRGGSTAPLRKGAQLERFRSRLVYYRKVFPPLTALLLSTVRVLRLPLDALLDFLAVLLTLGRHRPTLDRLRIRLFLLAWLLSGCPPNWGLPDKCPRTRQ